MRCWWKGKRDAVVGIHIRGGRAVVEAFLLLKRICSSSCKINNKIIQAIYVFFVVFVMIILICRCCWFVGTQSRSSSFFFQFLLLLCFLQNNH